MPRQDAKLHNPFDFLAARREGRFVEMGVFRLNCRAFSARISAQVSQRFGIVASKHLLGDAVRRNRAKRVFRELLRMHAGKLPALCDVSVVVRRGYAKLSFEELSDRFAAACNQLACYFEKHLPPPELAKELSGNEKEKVH